MVKQVGGSGEVDRGTEKGEAILHNYYSLAFIRYDQVASLV